MQCKTAVPNQYLTERGQFDEEACYYCYGYFCRWVYHFNGSIFLGSQRALLVSLFLGIKEA